MSIDRHVVKVGGSLLRCRDVADRLVRFARKQTKEQPASHLILIVGGGEPVEWLRRLDKQNPLGDKAAHWSAIGMMDANTLALAGWLSETNYCDDWNALTESAEAPGCTLLATGRFLRKIEPTLPGIRLPIGWRVTSDSIAARIAVCLESRLTLLKSKSLETPTSVEGWRQLADQGVVDSFFPELVESVTSVNLATLDSGS